MEITNLVLNGETGHKRVISLEHRRPCPEKWDLLPHPGHLKGSEGGNLVDFVSQGCQQKGKVRILGTFLLTKLGIKGLR